MTASDWNIILTPVAVFLGRLWSRWEHRKTGETVVETQKDIVEIKLSINGEVEKKLSAAREEGRQEERDKLNNKSL